MNHQEFQGYEFSWVTFFGMVWIYGSGSIFFPQGYPAVLVICCCSHSFPSFKYLGIYQNLWLIRKTYLKSSMFHFLIHWFFVSPAFSKAAMDSCIPFVCSPEGVRELKPWGKPPSRDKVIETLLHTLKNSVPFCAPLGEVRPSDLENRDQ